MVLVLVIVGVVVVTVIGLVAVGTVVGRLGVEPARNVFEGEEALEFAAQALPAEVTAELSYEDVARLQRLHLDFLHRQGVARSGGDLDDSPGVHLVDPDDAVAYVLRRAALAEFHPREAVVREVIAAHLAYFEAIGVVDPVTGPDLAEVERELRAAKEAE